MNTMVWLSIASVAAVAALFIALATYLVLILRQLDPTGGTGGSYLAKIRLGLRAIEIETGHIPGEVVPLNQRLALIRDGLVQVDVNLGSLASAVQRQEER